MIPIVWFLVFSLLWTSVICVGAFVLTRGAIRAHFAHRLWQGAALLCVLPWALCVFSPFINVPIDAAPLPDFPLFEAGAQGGSPDPHADTTVASRLSWNAVLFYLRG